MADLIDNLLNALGATFDAKGRAHADCPFCGAAPGYRFYLFDLPSGRGYTCWSCGVRGSWLDLARHLSVGGAMPTARAVRAVVPRSDPPWIQDAAGWTLGALRAFCAAQGEARYQAWQAYKPLSRATIDRACLFVGPLPFWADPDKRHPHGRWYTRGRFLVVPLLRDGRVVGLRGRGDDGWVTASSSETILYGLDDLRPGAQVVICENQIDRLLLEQAHPDVCGLAPSTGATSLRNVRPEWIAALKAARPQRILVWLDHDLAGNGSSYHAHELYARWRATQDARRAANPALAARPYPTPPEPAGPVLANTLLEAGLPAQLYRWPQGSALGADLGDVLMQEMRQAA